MRCGSFQPLCLRKELLHTHKRGITTHSEVFSLKFVKSESNKMAFIVRKKLGNSPKRNLIKRRFREIVKNLPETGAHIHCLIIAKKEAFGYPFDKLDHEAKKVFAKIFNQLDMEI